MQPASMIRHGALVAVLAVTLLPIGGTAQVAPEKVSEFGRYEGYSEERFDEWITTSRYLTMRDGTRIAIDVVRPAVEGKPVAEPFPVIWTHSRYHRTPQELLRVMGAPQADSIRSMVDAQPDLQRLVRHGYVVAAAGVRGSGASFGRYEGLFSPAETRDACEIIEWLAAQPWCDGNVGMFGGSYLGITQYMAASQAPPALKAIFPVVAAFDLYEVIFPGGIFRDDMVRHWAELTLQMDTEWPAPRVDGDEDGALVAAAKADHERNWEVFGGFRAAPFRDSVSGDHAWTTHNPSPFVSAINEAKVPAYHWNGWLDVFVTDATVWYANYAGPQRLTIGAWPHGSTPDQSVTATRVRLRSAEQHRWFDRWLKGIDNGVADEPAVQYATMVDPGEWTWHAAETWPPPGVETTRFYFAGGPSGSVESVNDGRLTTDTPPGGDAADTYRVDRTTTTGTASRWDNAVGVGAMVYPDMTANDRRSLTYTTAALDEDVTVTGHPVVTLWASSTATDGDFYVLLEEVDGAGVSHYVTEGVLRASHRALAKAPWNNLGLPYQRCAEADRRPLVPGEPTELVFDLHPTSTVFNAGHRIRVTVMGADADNTEELEMDDRPEIRLHRSLERPSSILLPIMHLDGGLDRAAMSGAAGAFLRRQRG